MKKNISYNRTAIVNQGGQVSSITISRAMEQERPNFRM